MAAVLIAGQQDLRNLARDLRRQADGRERTARLRKELTGAARPLVPAIRTAIRGLPGRNQPRRLRRFGLRASMARSVTLQVRTAGSKAGVAVFMNPRKMPNTTKSLPQYFEGVPGYLVLKHPLFGDRTHMYPQHTPTAGYFTRSIEGADQRAQAAIAEIVNRTAREIETG